MNMYKAGLKIKLAPFDFQLLHVIILKIQFRRVKKSRCRRNESAGEAE